MLSDSPNPLESGRLFEQWFIQEVRCLNDYADKDFRLSFWRTSHGAEVDLVIERAGKILGAYECKSTANISAADLTGLRSFSQTHPNIPLHIVAPVREPRKIGAVSILSPLDALAQIRSL